MSSEIKPGAAWRAVVAEADFETFSSAFSDTVRLEMSAIDKPIVGAERLRRYFDASRSMFDGLAFTKESVSHERTYLEWEGRFQGRSISGTTILVRNDAGLIDRIQIYQRPLEQVIAFSTALSGRLADQNPPDHSRMRHESNKALVIKALDTLFNKRDYATAEKYWSPDYVQHSALIAQGREGLFALARSLPHTLVYEHGVIVAEGDYVMVHGRYSGNGRSAALVAVDIVRVENGVLTEHWDVLQDEVTQMASASGLPMFGDAFPNAKTGSD